MSHLLSRMRAEKRITLVSQAAAQRTPQSLHPRALVDPRAPILFYPRPASSHRSVCILLTPLTHLTIWQKLIKYLP